MSEVPRPRPHQDHKEGHLQPELEGPDGSPIFPPMPARKPEKTNSSLVPKLSMISAVLITASIASVSGGVVGVSVSNRLAPPQTITNVVTKNTDQEVNWTNTAARVLKSVVTVETVGVGVGGEGSGVVLDDEGHVVTNTHVVNWYGKDAKVIVVVNNRAYAADIVGMDIKTDIAVLKLAELPPKEHFTPITFANSDEVVVGNSVMAVGSPLGLAGTTTTGIVSAVDRPINNAQDERISITNAIQTSAAINPGNSGGALVNLDGELIGINSSIASLTGSVTSGSIGIGFAVPSNLVKRITDQIIAEKKVEHAFLGVQVKDKKFTTPGGPATGAEIITVVEDSPAEKAGLEEGDIVLRIEGEDIVGSSSLAATILEQNVGDEVGIQVMDQDGVEREVILELVKAP